MSRIKAVIFDWAGTTLDYGCFAPIKGFIKGFERIGIAITNDMARKPMGLSKIDHTRAIAAMLDTPPCEQDILRAYEGFEDTLFADLEKHCDIKDYVIDTVAALRERGIKIGSTTGYTAMMMERVLPVASAQGYSPDCCVTADSVPKGRPYPYMILENMKRFGIADPKEVVKVGDTIADIEEGKSANCFSVGIVMGSSELGYNRLEVASLSPGRLETEKARVRNAYLKAGADYVINDMDELMGVIEDIERKLERA